MTAEAPHSRTAARFVAHAALLLVLGLAACGDQGREPQASRPETGAPAPAAAPDASGAAPAPTAAPAGIGRVHSMEGDVRILGARGEERAQAGVLIERGETVRTLVDAWALLAMNDGASITVRADSELRFDEYRYVPDGEPQQNFAAMSLVKGALRSITGLIGQTNRDGYRVATPNATIGIRGTDHEPAYYPPPPPGQKADHPPGTYDKVNEGESVIRRPAGELPVRRGQTAFAPPEPRARPQLLAKPPVFYQRYAEVDRRVVEPLRVEFHRQFVQDEQRRQEQRRQQFDVQKKAQEQRKQDAQKKKQEEQKKERDARDEKRAEERNKKRDERRKDGDKKAAPGKGDDQARQQQRADPREAAEKQREAAQKQRQEQSQQDRRDRARVQREQQQNARQQREPQDRARQQQQQQQERMRRQQEEQQERLRQQQQEKARQRQQVPQR